MDVRDVPAPFVPLSCRDRQLGHPSIDCLYVSLYIEGFIVLIVVLGEVVLDKRRTRSGSKEEVEVENFVAAGTRRRQRPSRVMGHFRVWTWRGWTIVGLGRIWRMVMLREGSQNARERIVMLDV